MVETLFLWFRKDTFSDYKLQQKSTAPEYEMTREDAIKNILDALDPTDVVRVHVVLHVSLCDHAVGIATGERYFGVNCAPRHVRTPSIALIHATGGSKLPSALQTVDMS